MDRLNLERHEENRSGSPPFLCYFQYFPFSISFCFLLCPIWFIFVIYFDFSQFYFCRDLIPRKEMHFPSNAFRHEEESRRLLFCVCLSLSPLIIYLFDLISFNEALRSYFQINSIPSQNRPWRYSPLHPLPKLHLPLSLEPVPGDFLLINRNHSYRSLFLSGS